MSGSARQLHQLFVPARALHLCGLALCLVLCCTLPGGTVSPAVARLLEQFPQLQGGGQTADTFAAWANTSFLLQNAYEIGPLVLPGEHVAGTLYLAAGQPIAAYWTTAGTAAPVQFRLGKAAKVFGRGSETRPLRGAMLATSATAWPHFLRNVSARYVVDAAQTALANQDTSPATPQPLADALGDLLGQPAREAWTLAHTRMITTLDGKDRRAISPAMTALLQQVDRTLLAVYRTNQPEERSGRFPLALRLLHYRLRLLELSFGLADWQHRLPHPEPLSDQARMQLNAHLLHQLAQAQPKTGLHGYPVTGGLLRDALAMLSGAGDNLDRQQQLQLAFLNAALPYLRGVEPASAQNLTAVAVRTGVRHLALTITLRNDSAEEASGALHFTWNAHTVTAPLHIAAGESVKFTYPIRPEDPPITAITLEGELADGTPLQATTLAVTEAGE